MLVYVFTPNLVYIPFFSSVNSAPAIYFTIGFKKIKINVLESSLIAFNATRST